MSNLNNTQTDGFQGDEESEEIVYIYKEEDTVEHNYSSTIINNDNKSVSGIDINNEKEVNIVQKTVIQEKNVKVEFSEKENIISESGICYVEYLNMTVYEIINRYSQSILNMSDYTINYNKVLFQNKYFKFYAGKIKNSEMLSVLVLNNIDKLKTEFGRIIATLTCCNSVQASGMLKLRGISMINNDTTCILFFDSITSSLFLKQKEGIIMDTASKFASMFFLIEMTYMLHIRGINLYDLRPSTIMFNGDDEFRYLVPIPEYLSFNASNESKGEAFKEEGMTFNRYTTPECAIEKIYIPESDLWIIGCIFIEVFSDRPIWHDYKESQMIEDLKKYYVPRINSDIPHQTWGMVCDCLNPFREARINSKELFDKYVSLMMKMKISFLIKHLEKYSIDANEKSMLLIDDDSTTPRKCLLHPKNDIILFCAQCSDVICDQCKSTIHLEHFQKGLVYEFLDFVNLATHRAMVYRDKFSSYITDSKLQNLDAYNSVLEENKEGIISLYKNHIGKIEDNFTRLHALIDALKEQEIRHLDNFRDNFFNMFNNVVLNYQNLTQEIDSVKVLLENKEKGLVSFQTLSQNKKEDMLKNIAKEENIMNTKKKTIIKYVTNFNREIGQVEYIKRYFEVFIEKYKESKYEDIIKLLEKKMKTTISKHQSIEFESYLKLLVSEFEQICLFSSRNYFANGSKELFISIVNTNKIFSYNLEANKYYITEVNFDGMPVNKFPNYSRSLIINGNLLVTGGYDDFDKITLPYFFFYDRFNKTITRLSDMLYGHSAHSILYVPPHFCVVVSGSGTLKCEKYSMEDNSWSELPDITVCRQNCSLFYYNKQYLYAFGGAYWDDSKKGFIYLESVERLSLGYGSVAGAKSWEQIQTYKYGEVNLKKSVMAIISITSNKIYLVGGSISYNTYSDEIISFDFIKNEFSLKEGFRLPRKTCFPNKSFLFQHDKAYQLDNDGHVYEFDLLKEEILVLKENSTVKPK